MWESLGLNFWETPLLSNTTRAHSTVATEKLRDFRPYLTKVTLIREHLNLGKLVSPFNALHALQICIHHDRRRVTNGWADI